MPLGVDAEKASGRIKSRMMPHAGEKIENTASAGLCMKHAIGSHERKSLRAG